MIMRESPTSAGTGSYTPADSGVDDGIEQVDGEVHGHHDGSGHEHDGLDDRNRGPVIAS